MIGFHEIRFPEDVSWGSSGGPVYKTQIYESLRGYEKRNVDWSQPLMQFDVAYGIKTDAQIERVIDFFNARQGRLYGFRYKNWCNYQISNGPIATGDGHSLRLPMWKFYGKEGARHYKRLWKIVRGSVRNVHVGGTPLTEGRDFFIDYDAGELLLNFAPGYGIPVMAENLEFDEPVRFDTDTLENVLEAYNNNSISSLPLVGIRGTYSAGTVYSPSLEEVGQRDPHFNQIRLLLNFDDNIDDPVTYDSSMMSAVLPLQNGARIDREVFRHGGGSLQVGPYGRAIIDGDVQDISNMPFTLEIFAQRPTYGEAYQTIIGRWDHATGNKSYQLRYNMITERLEFLISTTGADELIVISTPWEATSHYFDYLRLDRTSSGWWVFRINGRVAQTSREYAPMFKGEAGTSVCCLPGYSEHEGPFQARVDSLRLTAGMAREVGFGTVDIPAAYPRLGTHGVARTSVGRA